MARVNAHASDDIWHLSIEDLFGPPSEPPTVPHMKTLLVSTVAVLLAGCGLVDVTQNPAPVGAHPFAPPVRPRPPPPVNPAGIWDVNDTVNGNTVSEIALIGNGLYFSLGADEFGCTDITGGTYTVSGQSFTGSGTTDYLGSCPNGPSSPGGGSPTWTLSGYYLAPHLDLNFTYDSGALGVPTLGATLDPLYNQPSSLATLVGNWGDGGGTLTVNPDGTFFEQQGNGCVITGAYTVIDPTHNLYGVSFVFDSNTCNNSIAGIPFVGLAYLHDSNHLYEDAAGPVAGDYYTVVVFDGLYRE